MKKAIAFTVLLLALLSAGILVLRSRAKNASDKNMLVVQVYRDNKSDFRADLDRRFYDFNYERHRTKSGRLIFVATVEPLDYRSELEWKVARVQPEIVILNSEDDKKLVAGLGGLKDAKSACGPKDCPAFIPSWVCGGDKSEATMMVFEAVTKQQATSPTCGGS